MIYQIYGGLSYGDGVSNVIVDLHNFLNGSGVECITAVNYIDPRLSLDNIMIWNDISDIILSDDDIILYHMANGCSLNYEMEFVKCKKILVFHNVTYSYLFRGIDEQVVKNCALGELDARQSVGKYDRAIALSDFSKKNLVDYGWNEKEVVVVPLVELKKKKMSCHENKKQHKPTRFLFVGRISPNKKIEDIIRIFSYYVKNIEFDAELILVGTIQFKNYYKALVQYVGNLELKNVIFKDFVTDEELEEYYNGADLFLCMSEHEGFCIPIMEAMAHDIPVIAYNATAVPDTMGDAGILVDTKDEKTVCAEIVKLLDDCSYKKEILNRQRNRVSSYSISQYKAELLKLIQEVRSIKSEKEINNQGSFQEILYNVNMLMKTNYIEGLELLSDCSEIVIYGVGKAGKNLYEYIKKNKSFNIVAFCDNNCEEDIYYGIPILKHGECIAEYRNALYVITPQKVMNEIKELLIYDGICKEHIICYNMKKLMLSMMDEVKK